MTSTDIRSKQGRQELEASRPSFIYSDRAFRGWARNEELAHFRDSVDVQTAPIKELSPHDMRQLTDAVQSELYRQLYGAIGVVRLETDATKAINQAPLPRSAKLESAFEELDDLADLEPDWDSYDGLPPTSKAVSKAGRLMVAVGERLGPSVGESATPYGVMPIADGGVQVEWRGATQHIEVNIGPKGAISYLLIENPADTPTFRKGRELPVADALTIIEDVLRS